MTLQQFFDYVVSNPSATLWYFLGVPLIAFVAGIFSKNEGHLSPWNYVYAVLIYMVCLPGIFAVTLNIYFFFWERRSILDTELFIQVIPILSMIASLSIIKQNVDLDLVPGFDKLSGLMIIIGILLTLMWILDRTHIYAITFMPFPMVIGIIVGGVLLVRYFSKKLIA
ncbi:MAG: hypothetical protein LKG19_00280 [Saprospiraceae bacterium]|jgi:hypothetical protein|nr:hypothetical protein [Candidatus Defluviibacterium haderslevense]MCI1264978.1 hypothetical protein [Saprospiraceae bacterium]